MMTIGFHTDAFSGAYWSYLSIECDATVIEGSLAWLRCTLDELGIDHDQPGTPARER